MNWVFCFNSLFILLFIDFFMNIVLELIYLTLMSLWLVAPQFGILKCWNWKLMFFFFWFYTLFVLSCVECFCCSCVGKIEIQSCWLFKFGISVAILCHDWNVYVHFRRVEFSLLIGLKSGYPIQLFLFPDGIVLGLFLNLSR